MIHATPALTRRRDELPFLEPRCYCSTTRGGITIVTDACRKLTEQQAETDRLRALPLATAITELLARDLKRYAASDTTATMDACNARPDSSTDQARQPSDTATNASP